MEKKCAEGIVNILNQNELAKKELVAKLVGLTSNQRTVLVKIIEKASLQAKWKLREVLERSELAHG